MATISLCMIVKNEEKILARCLDSLAGLYDEAIIVDTGSTDKTKEIALNYTDKVYDFVWVDDFAKARNYAMSMASCDYIYMADADEVIDEENRKKFQILKAALDGSVEIVQMYYANQLSNGSVYNFDREPRAKLYKRVRNFEFMDPVHEVVRELPIVYDSDIDIIHLQEASHSNRDLETFRKAVARDGVLSKRLISMYARELIMAGSDEDFLLAEEYFSCVIDDAEGDLFKEITVVLAKIALIKKDAVSLLKYSIKDVACEGSSEMCCILGDFFQGLGDLNEAAMWFYNAGNETKPILDIRYGYEIPFNRLAEIYDELGMPEEAQKYRSVLKG